MKKYQYCKKKSLDQFPKWWKLGDQFCKIVKIGEQNCKSKENYHILIGRKKGFECTSVYSIFNGETYFEFHALVISGHSIDS
jgi:hypothetical protein